MFDVQKVNCHSPRTLFILFSAAVPFFSSVKRLSEDLEVFGSGMHLPELPWPNVFQQLWIHFASSQSFLRWQESISATASSGYQPPVCLQSVFFDLRTNSWCKSSSSNGSQHCQHLRSIDHVCKSEERHHPHPTPPHDLRSIDHVCKSDERHHPHPTPPPPREKRPVCVASNMCASARYVIIPTPPHPTLRETSRVRSIKHVFKWKKHHQSKNRRTSRGRWVGVYPTTTTTTTTTTNNQQPTTNNQQQRIVSPPASALGGRRCALPPNPPPASLSFRLPPLTATLLATTTTTATATTTTNESQSTPPQVPLGGAQRPVANSSFNYLLGPTIHHVNNECHCLQQQQQHHHPTPTPTPTPTETTQQQQPTTTTNNAFTAATNLCAQQRQQQQQQQTTTTTNN